MESSLLLHHRGLTALPTRQRAARGARTVYQRPAQKPRYSSSIAAVMTKAREAVAGDSINTAPATEYRDSWFDRFAIRYLSQSVQATTGVKNTKEGYDSLIEAASVVSRSFGPKEQEELVIKSLAKAFPALVLKMIRIIMRPSKFSREYFATFTTIFFSWLVGRCEVRESDFQGRKEKNVVYIPKCRFLESTNCVGMCTNMCKMPSQKFIQDSLGMPVNMIPNFEDKSCEMIFGQHPPTDDPALKQPCYQSLCIAKQNHGVDCSSC